MSSILFLLLLVPSTVEHTATAVIAASTRTGPVECLANPMRRIEITGLEHVADDTVRREILFREGEHYDERKLGPTIQRINGLGLFEAVSLADVDVQIRSCMDTDPCYVDITFHLREKRSPQSAARQLNA